MHDVCVLNIGHIHVYSVQKMHAPCRYLSKPIKSPTWRNYNMAILGTGMHGACNLNTR